MESIPITGGFVKFLNVGLLLASFMLTQSQARADCDCSTLSSSIFALAQDLATPNDLWKAANGQNVNFLDLQLGSTMFNVEALAGTGTSQLGSLKDPGSQMPSGLGNFTIAPQVVIKGALFGFKFNVFEATATVQQEKNAPTDANGAPKGQGIVFGYKILGINISSKLRGAAKTSLNDFQNQVKNGGTATDYARDSRNPLADRTGAKQKPLDFRRSYSSSIGGGKKLEIPIVPPISVFIDFGFVLSAAADLSYGIDTPFGGAHGQMSITLAPDAHTNSSKKTYCEAKDAPSATDQCNSSTSTQQVGMFQTNTSSSSSQFVTPWDNVSSVYTRAVNDFSSENTKVFLDSANKTWADLKDYQTYLGGNPNAICDALANTASMGSQLRKAYDDVNAAVQETQMIANVLNGSTNITQVLLSQVKANVEIAVQGQATGWVEVDLGIDLDIAQLYVGIIGTIDLIKVRASGDLNYVGGAEFIDLTANLTTTILSGEIDAIYSLIIGYDDLSVTISGEYVIVSFPGQTHFKQWLVGRIDLEPKCASVYADCLGSNPDPRCKDGGISSCLAATPKDNFKTLQTQYAGVSPVSTTQANILYDGARIIASSDSASDLQNASLASAYSSDVTRYVSARMDPSTNTFVKTVWAGGASGFNSNAESVLGVGSVTGYKPNLVDSKTSFSGFTQQLRSYSNRPSMANLTSQPVGTILPALPEALPGMVVGMVAIPPAPGATATPAATPDMTTTLRQQQNLASPIVIPKMVNNTIVGGAYISLMNSDSKLNEFINVEDLNLMSNAELVNAAIGQQLGSCTAFTTSDGQLQLSVGGAAYPPNGSPTGNVFENVLNTQLGCLYPGVFSQLKSIDSSLGVGADGQATMSRATQITNGHAILGSSVSSTGTTAYAACLLRQANAQNLCFETTHVLTAVQAANLSDSQAITYFVTAPAVIQGPFVSGGYNQLNGTAGFSTLFTTESWSNHEGGSVLCHKHTSNIQSLATCQVFFEKLPLATITFPASQNNYSDCGAQDGPFQDQITVYQNTCQQVLQNFNPIINHNYQTLSYTNRNSVVASENIAYTPTTGRPWSAIAIKQCLINSNCSFNLSAPPPAYASSCSVVNTSSGVTIPGSPTVTDAMSLNECIGEGTGFANASLFCGSNHITSNVSLTVSYKSYQNGVANPIQTKTLGQCVVGVNGIVVGVTDPGMSGILSKDSDGGSTTDTTCSLQVASAINSNGTAAANYQAPVFVRNPTLDSNSSAATDGGSCQASLGFYNLSDQANKDETCQSLPGAILTQLIPSTYCPTLNTSCSKVTLMLQSKFNTLSSNIGTCTVDLKARANQILPSLNPNSTAPNYTGNGLNYSQPCVLQLMGLSGAPQTIMNTTAATAAACQSLVPSGFNCSYIRKLPQAQAYSTVAMWPVLTFGPSASPIPFTKTTLVSDVSAGTTAYPDSTYPKCSVAKNTTVNGGDESCTLGAQLSYIPSIGVKTAVVNPSYFTGNSNQNAKVDFSLAGSASGKATGTGAVTLSPLETAMKSCSASWEALFNWNSAGTTVPADADCGNFLAAVMSQLPNYNASENAFTGTTSNPPYGVEYSAANPTSVFLQAYAGCAETQYNKCSNTTTSSVVAVPKTTTPVVTTPVIPNTRIVVAKSAIAIVGSATGSAVGSAPGGGTGTGGPIITPPSYAPFAPFTYPSTKALATLNANSCGFTFVRKTADLSSPIWVLTTATQAKAMQTIRTNLTGTTLTTGACDPTASPFGGGGNTSVSDPYLICSVAQFNAIANGPVGARYQLTQDLDFSTATFTPVTLLNGGGFDGAGFNVKNISFTEVTANLTQALGLFRTVKNAEIKNIVLQNVNIVGGDRVGALAGYAYSSSFLNIQNTASSTFSLKGKGSVGGLVGEALDGNLFSNIQLANENLVSTANGTQVGNGNTNSAYTDAGVGGVVGVMHHTSAGAGATLVQNQSMSYFSKVSVSGTLLWSSGNDVMNWTETGGILGYGSGVSIIDSTFAGSITGGNLVGGIVGDLDQLNINSPNILQRVKVKTTTAGIVGRGNAIGGIYGSGYSIQVTDAMMLGSISGANYVGGVSGTGCGNTLTRAANFASVQAQTSAAGLDATNCVLSVIDSFSLGSVTATSNQSTGFSAGLIAGGYLSSNLTTSYALAKVTAASSVVGVSGVIGNYNTKGIVGAATNIETLSNVYYLPSLNSKLSDTLATALTDANATNSSSYVGFDFTSTWVMPTQVPTGMNSNNVFPIQRWLCGQEGFVCP